MSYPYNKILTMNDKRVVALFMAAMLCVLAACKKEDVETIIPDKIKIAETTASDGLKATLWADQRPLIVGYNPIYLTLTDASGELINKTVTIHPVMDMHTMEHSSPVEQPVFDASKGWYAGAVVFTMPSGERGAWKLNIEVDGREIAFDMTIVDAPANTKLMGTYVGTDDERYTIALVQPLAPKTGSNELEILVNRRADMHNFPPVDELEVVFNPEMPSMGHGSPNNIDPIGIGEGRYKGKVNFTMTGDWRLHFTLKRNGQVVVEDATLDILF